MIDLQEHRCVQPRAVMWLDFNEERGSVEEAMMTATLSRNQWRTICQAANFSLTIVTLNKVSYKFIVKNWLQRGVLPNPDVADW